MKIRLRSTLMAIAAIVACVSIQSCSDKKSYAELLEDENKAVNVFLSDHRVIAEIPADGKFETGENAPYYRLDNEGNLYMQVINVGNGEMATDNQVVYFRCRRASLAYYGNGGAMEWEGNSDNIESGDQSFRFNNTSLESSYQWGTGIQKPLEYLPLNSQVRLVVKSQLGLTSEIAYVVPFLYEIRYFPAKI
ncbi:MAG: DUF4827 domain-containing protein [Paramuribaculum sp.]|nr:DUF4827 domain-containing protein [Paramuribaculum sp.]